MKRVLVLMAACALVLVACGDDDGGSVREVGGSDSGSAAGSPSAPASGSGSGSAVDAECDAVGDKDDASATVDVKLDEFTITLDTRIVAAGKVHFALTNAGEEPHEFVVIRGVAADKLPLDDDGALDESKLADGALIGEVEPFPGGETCDGTFELAAGDYTLVCNIVEDHDGETMAHLEKGMVTTLTVT
jgi:hypothetical protein